MVCRRDDSPRELDDVMNDVTKRANAALDQKERELHAYAERLAVLPGSWTGQLGAIDRWAAWR